MDSILHDRIPYDTDARKLPGVLALDPACWLIRDERFDEQMALRDDLIRQRKAEVVALQETGRVAAQELLSAVLAYLSPDKGYAIGPHFIDRPDGISVALDMNDPLTTLGYLVQEDFCLLQKPDSSPPGKDGEHVLTGAVLCFPAGWMLEQKIGRPLVRIHRPVKAYDADIAKRVQRLFDGVRVGRPLWRHNALSYADPALFQPHKEGEHKYGDKEKHAFVRSERQTITRLPKTGAVVFSIHTFVVRREAVRMGNNSPLLG